MNAHAIGVGFLYLRIMGISYSHQGKIKKFTLLSCKKYSSNI